MKKLLFLLSNSILFSLSALFIYNLNSKNNSENSSFVLKQTKKEETDLSKIFGGSEYISVRNRSVDIENKVLKALQLKYPNIIFSQLEVEVKPHSRGGVDVIIKPKTSSTYTNTATIPCYEQTDISATIKEKNASNLGNIDINTKEKILSALRRHDVSDFVERDFSIENIKESSATVTSNEAGDFYGKVEVSFNSIKKTLESIIYDKNLEITKPTEDEIMKVIKKKYSTLANEKLDIKVEKQKKTITITSTNKTKFEGVVVLTYNLPKVELPKESKTEAENKEKNEKSKPDKEKEIKSKDLKDNEMDSEMLSDQPQDTPDKPSENTTIKNEVKKQHESPLIQSNPENKQPESEPDLSNSSTLNQPESKSNKTMNYNPPVIDKSLKSNSNTSNLQIPNKESSNSKKGSSGSKTGVIVGSTLGVSSVVVTGAIGSWIYFKKRK
ncbi:hypothetical protein MFERI14815_00350 [Mycoplasma feriruminatoris]|uniref:hypothetical protein n=1 Tax=Mycoplasma feriruminatoris TaxID=1179777 RepID=UPI00241FFA18|nr:hypothetical protein [Mycoplasma feriruminatoris]WFQ91743.1 hypothetical protein MFERI14815_00350 [Mycoplasma feriruminatoris]